MTSNGNPRVLLNFALKPDEIEFIRSSVPEATVDDVADQGPAAFERAIGEADVLLGRGDASTISPGALGRATRLRWIHSWAAGPNDLLYPEMLASDVVITSSVGSGAVAMAEHALMLMLMLNSGVISWIRAQDERRWERGVHPELRGLTCGLIGLGNTGQDLAQKLRAFHMKVIGIRRTPQATPNVDEVLPRERLHELLGRSDFVVVTAPITTETANMLGEPEFRAMRPTAYYICSSRGGVADEGALLRALDEHWIAGAGLDAFAQEPLPADSPLWAAPNTIVTPHIGAQTPMRRRASLEMFVANLRSYVEGRALSNVVDKRAGY